MRMAIDPLGGNRFYCTHCRMNCDSIQLFARGKDVTLRQAVLDLSTRVSLPTNAVRWWFPKWKERVCDPMSRVISVLEDGRNAIATRAESAWIEALMALRSWVGTDYTTLARAVATSVSAVSRRDLENAMSPWEFSTGKYRDKFLIVIPFCDVFNRPRTLMLFNHLAVSWTVKLPLYQASDTRSKVIDAGLCFLDQLEREEDVVFAVGDPRLALQMRCHHAFNNIEPIPIIGYLPETGITSWSQVRARRTIFWEPELSVDLFRQAKMADHAFVAMQPGYEGIDFPEISKSLVGFNVDVWRRMVTDSAVPWREALINWLLSLPEDTAISAVEELNLTATEAEDLVDIATGVQEAKLVELFGVAKQAQTVFVDGREISQAGGTWTEVSRLGPKLILDATIFLDRVQHPLSGGPETVVGYITREDTVIPFRDNLEEVQGNTPGWLTKKLLEEGQALPQISPVWSRRLFRIAQAINNPPTVPCVDHVGYVDGVGMVFPRFVVKDGRFIKGDKEPNLLDNAIPGQSLEPPNFPVTIPASAFDPEGPSVSVWGMVAMILANLEAQRFGAENKGLLVYAPDSGPHETMLQVSKSLDLPIYEYTSDMDVTSVDRGHALPVVVDARNLPQEHTTLTRYLFNPKPKSLMLLVSDLSPWKETSLAGWQVLAAGNPATAAFPFDCVPRAMFAGLKWLHETMNSRSSKLPLDVMYHTLFDELRPDGPVPADNIATIVGRLDERLIGDVGWDTTDADRSLYSLFYMYDQKRIKIDAAEGILSVPAGGLLTQFRKLTGCLVRLEDITYDLRRAGMLRGLPGKGIEIDVSDWHSIRRQYDKLMPPEGLCL